MPGGEGSETLELRYLKGESDVEKLWCALDCSGYIAVDRGPKELEVGVANNLVRFWPEIYPWGIFNSEAKLEWYCYSLLGGQSTWYLKIADSLNLQVIDYRYVKVLLKWRRHQPRIS